MKKLKDLHISFGLAASEPFMGAPAIIIDRKMIIFPCHEAIAYAQKLIELQHINLKKS